MLYPLAPEPLAVRDAPRLADGEGERRRILAEVLRAVPTLYATLPRYEIHGDYDPDNAFIIGDRISDGLDFGFSCADLHALNVTAGYYQAAGEAWKGGDAPPLLAAFLDSYLAVASFTVAEVEALLALSGLRRAATLVYWPGRSRGHGH